ncbi:uncharacterized protein LOC105186024 isoform X1 [Harpegnathos saltator]|uniref:uncharacterized protein LOC105186024 isoform X1 n=1 Tax=Harpegnathos saltator TaxID=610380 RepID=UPI000DBEDDFF|nr:uncharacterized protein LOC105186024 isoform X1 [Harpegnathos saltator]
MAEDNAHQAEECGVSDVERKPDRAPCRPRDQRAPKVKDKLEDPRLPTPPPLPDPQCPRFARERGVSGCRGGSGRLDEEEEEEDLVAYLNELAASPVEGHSFDYDTPNSATSAMGVAAGPFAEEAFEHLDRLCALTEQILELRNRSSKYFRRVRGLERAKALRNADRRLEVALANDEELLGDFFDEDTGFAESLLDAMLSNCREPPAQRRSERTSVRSPSSRQRSRSLALAEQTLMGAASVVDRAADADKTTARNVLRNGAPKVSKWTRVKAAFKWERACTNDLAEIAESGTAMPSTPTSRYLRIPDITAGSWSGSALSACTSELSSPSTPIGRVSPASSSNEEVFDEPRKNIINYPDRQSPQSSREDKKREDAERHGRSFDRDVSVTENTDSIELPNEASRAAKPLIRVTPDAASSARVAKDPEAPPRRPPPTLTITIPPNEEEVRSLSSPESMSPLPSSAQDSGGSSPQRPKARPDILSSREFKRQYSTIEEATTPAPKIQRQDSKWNKVRRAFLTNATFSVPPSPVRVFAAQSFASDDTRRARSCSESVEDLGKTVAGTKHCRAEALRDYQALREKFGAEFYRKLLEWERLKGNPPRVLAARNVRDGLPLHEERLAPEFRKKLQDWKRAKKGRRSGASIEQQRVSRRRLTDWQLWRSSSKPEPRCHGTKQSSVSSRGSCASIGSAGSFASDGKQHLCEDFVKRMEAWRRMSEAACRSSERPRAATSRVASDVIDETEFLALEKLLLLFGQRSRKERRESDAKQLNDCFDGDSRFTAASRGVSCGNEVLIRTSVGSYRFEGISREFTRKLYDWEKYRGISPRSSTFRLLGPGYTPFAQDSDEATLTESPSATGKTRALHWNLKRSKSDGSVFEGSLRDESYTLRRSTSLHSLISTDKLEDDNRMDALPTSNNPQSIKDHSEDTAVEDSEPEAMIVDIEDVIEETASPLERVQPHQTPVYSVAASETTSIAVPLGTVTSSHEPSPVFLVEAEDDDDDCGGWNGRTWVGGQEARSSENSSSPEHFPVREVWRERTTSLAEEKPSWGPWRKGHDTEDAATTAAGWTEKTGCSVVPDDDSVKFDRPIGWNRDAWDESGEIFQRYANEANRDSTVPESPTDEGDAGRNATKQQELSASQPKADDTEPAPLAENLGATSSAWSAEKLTDSPRTCERMNEAEKIEDPTDKSNDERKSDVEDHRDSEDAAKSKETMSTAGPRAYRLATMPSPPNCRNSREAPSNLFNLIVGDDKSTPECHDADTESESSARYENYRLPELQADVDRHYEILTFRTDACSDTLDSRFLYEPVGCRETPRDDASNRARENLSLSRLRGAETASFSGTPTSLLTDSTIRTVPITVSRNSEARRLERILINEETLNKVVVPTASAERPRPAESATAADETEARTNEEQQVTCGKKDSSSPRNMFVKTKRMIFGPFRRSEDRPSSRKESDSSVDERLLRSKSKSKSRSASPKLCRQDALLRPVSLSLPWPLRFSSKDNEAFSGAESRRSSAGKTDDAVTVQVSDSRCGGFISDDRASEDDKKPNDQLTNEEPAEINQAAAHQSATKSANVPVNARPFTGTTSPCALEQSDRPRATVVQQDRSTRRMQDESKRGRRQDEGEQRDKVKCERVQNEERRTEVGSAGQDEERADEAASGHGQDKARRQDENHAKNDAVPSDLMHKLRILSDAAARREGRATSTETSASSSSESRSSRIRRAKESFLSRRGGPFCRSMMEPTETGGRESDPWGRRSASQTSSSCTEMSKPGDIQLAESTSRPEETGDAGSSTVRTTAQDEPACSSGDQGCAREEDREVAVRADLVKSASAGMINVDPDTFGRLVAADRGCESLPRTIAKRRDSSGPLAKIVGKLKLSRLIRAKNADGGNMSTISTLCRQSLLINVRGGSEGRSGGLASDADDKGKGADEASGAIDE